MVKVMLDAFTELRRDEENLYILKVIKRGKKKRKVPPLPLCYRRLSQHCS